MTTTTHTRAAVLAVATLALAACGGGSDDSADSGDDDAAEQPAEAADSADADEAVGDVGEASEADAGEAGSDEGESGGGGIADISSATFEPGGVEYRTINFLDDPVDLYVVTDGIREAWTVETSVAPGSVTDFATPPVDGRYVITTEGSGDPTCVIDCVDTVVELSNGFPDNAPVRTTLLYVDADDGSASAFEIYETIDGEGIGSSNEMPAADPSTTLVAVSALAVRNPDFGMRLTVPGAEGCLLHLEGDSRVIGGNQVLTFDTGDASEFTIHSFDDSECAADPLGGPFPIAAAPGARFHGILHGDGPAVDALLVPMVGSPEGAPAGDTAGGSDGDSASRDEALALMTDEVVTEFGLDADSATCVAELIVDGVGADVLVVDGELIELDAVSDDILELVGTALVASVDTCGVDPSVFGG